MSGSSPPGGDRSERLGAAEAHYNPERYFREINRGARAAFRGEVLRVGGRAPQFSLPSLDGPTVSLRALLACGHVVLIFGCYSAPPCVVELPEIDRVLGAAGLPLSAALIYTREIHPGEDLPQGRFARHVTLADKLSCAARLRDELAIAMTVLVDDLGGSTHLAYGGLPFSQVVIHRDGTLVHRAEWASAGQLKGVLDNLELRDRREAAGAPGRLSYSETLWCSERLAKKPG